MEKAYFKSLLIIKELGITTEAEYKKALHKYPILSLKSLKLIANKKKFKDIIKIAKEVE